MEGTPKKPTTGFSNSKASMTIQNEIDRATALSEKLEKLVYSKEQFHIASDRDPILMAYWSILFDYDKGILGLLSVRFCGSAFALLRPVVETLVRAHVMARGSDEDVLKIREDKYFVNFKTVGQEIDHAFQCGTLFQKLLMARDALHGYTHSGIHQVASRFDGLDLTPNYSEGAIVEVIHTVTSAVFLATILITKHFGLEDEWKAASQMFEEWGNHL